MCGLYISFGVEPAPERLDRVAHRGPDGTGWRVFDSPAGPVVLGHRRLAILDLSDRAAQPMSFGGGRFWIVHNGEIYNFRDLRSELERAGRIFRTESDTEVIVAAYAEWGPACVERLNGMFAFVIWDDVEKVLFVCRDRFGVKPLFLALSGQGGAFASEIKQIFDFNGASGMCEDVALDFLETGLTNHRSATMFDAVKHFPAANWQIVDLSAAGVRIRPGHRYWHPPDPPRLGPATGRTGMREAALRWRGLFDAAIDRHLVSDAPLGFCLSGGIDSSAITLAAAERLGRPVIAVSAVFPGQDVDESRFIDLVARTGRIQSIRTELRAQDAFDTLDAIAATQDEPFGSASILVQSQVFAAARQAGVKVMLDGQGADELTAGYPDLYTFAIRDLVRAGDIAGLARHIVGSRKTRRFDRQMAPLLRRFMRISPSSRSFVRREPRGQVLARAMSEAGFPSSRTLAEHCRILVTILSLPMLLRYEDRNSMAVGIEARVPYLDADLAEFCLGLEGGLRIRNGWTKAIMREGLRDLLPAPIAQRRDKIGLSAPQEAWLRGPLRAETRRRAREVAAAFPSLIDQRAAEGVISAGLDGGGDLGPVWRLLSFGAWARAYGFVSA